MAKTIRANASVHQGYRTLAEIGRGAYGVVLKAEHRETGEIRAIKSLYDGAYDDEALRRFKAEAELMHGFDHPNIVRVHEVHLDALSPSIIMDFVDGPDLRQLIKRDGPLPVADVVHIACDMARAFDHFHPDVVHRDLKPENILRQPPPDRAPGQAPASGGRARYVLTDFGIARRSNLKLTVEGQRGTPEYMSPEHVDGKELKPAADYWGLGVVLYEALTGRVPFQLRSSHMGDLAALAAAITKERATSIRALRPEVPEWLEQTVLGCLAKAPEARPPTGDALVKNIWRGTAQQVSRADVLLQEGKAAEALSHYSAVEGFFPEDQIPLQGRIQACRAKLPAGYTPPPPPRPAPVRKPTQRVELPQRPLPPRPAPQPPPALRPVASGGSRSRANLWASIAAVVLIAGAGSILYIGYNASPLARDDSATTRDDQPVTIAVLANDSDPDVSKPLRNEQLTVYSVTDPPHGRTRVVDGAIEYIPDGGFTGEDAFRYVVGDTRGRTADATVRVTVTESDGTRERLQSAAAREAAQRLTDSRFSDLFRAALPADASEILVDDRFDARGTWDLANEDSGRVAVIQEGSLILEQRREGYFGSSLIYKRHRDVIARFTVSQLSGETNNGGGLIFHRDDSGEYSLLVSGDGHLRVARYDATSNAWSDLVPWSRSDNLRTGLGAQNVVEARIIGNSIAVYINGTFEVSSDGLRGSGGDELGFTASTQRRFAFGDLVVVGLDT